LSVHHSCLLSGPFLVLSIVRALSPDHQRWPERWDLRRGRQAM